MKILFFHVSSAFAYRNYQYQNGKLPIMKTKNVKSLGILFDENISWEYNLAKLSGS